MKKGILLALTICLAVTSLIAQPAPDEEKIKKAVVLLKKMTSNPDQAMSLYQELEAMKLSKAERKEAENRMQQQLMQNAGIPEEMQKKVTGRMTKEETEAMKKEMTAKQAASVSGITGISESEVKKRIDDFNRTIPALDQSRINALPGKILTQAEVRDLLAAFQKNTLQYLPAADREKADEIYNKLKAAGSGSMLTGNVANGLWFSDLNYTSLWLMSRACLDDPGNINNLNNYAAYLTMYGAEEIALPVLQYLNKQNPGSATILNNIGQAWFGLGELKMAYKYLDSSIAKFPKNSQANQTKSLIEEDKGNKEAAIDAAKKSLEEGWSDSKEQRLKKLGYQLTPEDIPVHIPADGMGLNKFNFPSFPKSYQEAVTLEAEWSKFKKACLASADRIRLKMDYQAKQQYAADHKRTIIANGQYKKLLSLYGDGDGGWTRKREKFNKEIEAACKDIDDMKKTAHNAMDQLEKKYEGQCGEGLPCPAKEICQAYRKINDQFIADANTRWEVLINSYFRFLRSYYNADVYLQQYMMESGAFEMYKSGVQIQYLEEMSQVSFQWLGILTPGTFPNACDEDKKDGLARFKGLPDYDDIHCTKIDTLTILSTRMETRCNKMTTTFKIDGKITGIPALKDVKLEIGFTEDLNRKNLTILPTERLSTTIEIGVKAGGKEWELGTNKDELKVGVKAEVGAIIEIDKNGISEICIKTGVGVNAGTSEIPVVTGGEKGGGSSSVNLVGGEVKWSVKAGPSLKGKSVFKDMKNIKYGSQ
jgi:tetratricopeptide (TPR) repeat protein